MFDILQHDWKVARTPRQKILAARDHAVLSLFLESFIRLKELAQLKAEDIEGASHEAVKRSITVSEAGHLGGLETLSHHGGQHFVAAGRRGQKVIAHHYTTEDRRWGSLGGRPRKPKLANMGEKGQST